MEVKNRHARQGMIPPLELSHGFRPIYERHAEERHQVRLSRNAPGGLLEGNREEVLLALRPWRRHMPTGGIMAVVWWLDKSAAMQDALIGDAHGA